MNPEPSRCDSTQRLGHVHQCECLRESGHPADGEHPSRWHQCGGCGAIWSDERELEDNSIYAGKLAQVIRLPSTPPIVPIQPGNDRLPPGAIQLDGFGPQIVELMRNGVVCDCGDYESAHPSHTLVEMMVAIANQHFRRGRESR